MAKMLQFVAVGACYVDTILDVPHFPQEDDKLRATSLSRRRGGNGANTIEVLQELDIAARRREKEDQGRSCPSISSHLVAVLPRRSSAAVELIRQSLHCGDDDNADDDDDRRAAGSGVSLGSCLFREEHEEPASAHIIRSESTGSRTIVNYNDLPEMTVEEFRAIADGIVAGREEAAVGGEAWFHFEGRIPDVTLECMRYLRQRHQVQVSVEIEKPGRQGLQELVAEADIVFFSRAWAQVCRSRVSRFWEMAERLSKLLCT
ncbi:hypothetical protein Micbo1qcDRAFT_211272 [Microdochium bolleyi]|uniref:Ribokinase-like protein n=1 Tax=Microdochium bolleyi TaxID=196109 RepID=A0A136JIM2_9PEZI|nr:hypothetical protein Micbo1qcDRAFT_211272 [Microdochium bolleyi]